MASQLNKTLMNGVLLVWSILSYASGQITIENPNKPTSKNAGRTVNLEEVWRIKDDGEKVILKGRIDLALSDDQSVFFLAGSRLYKYSKDGEFIFKILKDGQGPRECQSASRFFFEGNRVRVLAFSPPKVLDYDPDGRYIKETKTTVPHRFYFLSFLDGKIYGIQDEIAYSEDIHKGGLIETPFRLYEISENFHELKKAYDFPVEHYIKKGRWSRRTMVDWVAWGHYLFAVHTAEYKIVKFDLRRGAIEKTFKRKYDRLKLDQKEGEEDIYERVPKDLAPPPFQYAFDIHAIRVIKDSLWAVTSTTKDNGPAWLIDVFDMEGKYVDCFYLQFPSNNENPWITYSVLSDDGFIILPEESQDGYVSIVKYRIKEKY
jgi:hypothetical protein